MDKELNIMELILKYFPTLTETQRAQFAALYDLYMDWNSKINVISRKDITNLYEHHVLHSLGIAKYTQFAPGTTIMDLGTGGGFPGIPLAVMFPHAKFTLCDSIGKKITVVKGVCEGAGITNIDARHTRVEQIPERFDYVVSRAVTEMPQFVKWIWSKIERGQRGTLPNGILYLKGGDLAEELAATRRHWDLYDIRTMFDDEFFDTKRVVYTPYK